MDEPAARSSPTSSDWRMIQLVVPSMRLRGGSTIVNVTSMGGKITTPFGGWYHASKFAVEGLSDALRMGSPRSASTSW